VVKKCLPGAYRQFSGGPFNLDHHARRRMMIVDTSTAKTKGANGSGCMAHAIVLQIAEDDGITSS
jgi:hypothetical protein